MRQPRLSRLAAVLLLSPGLVSPAPAAPQSPNFLVIIADDCTYNDLPLYGGANAKTPNIDHLASQGLTFNQAYLCSSMCQPCRAELYSGQYPLHNGCAWNHSASRPQTTSLPHHLRPLGYRVGLTGKVHVKPAPAFPFDKIPGFDPRCVHNPTDPHDVTAIRDYMDATKHETPFCLVVALVDPHRPWVMGDASQYPPQKIKLPANLGDTPTTRKRFADYLAEITYMDGQVGDILQALEASGSSPDTLVLFTSEQGAQFPGCKWTNWNTGVHTALVARWPDQVAAGARTDALVQYADIAPTLVSLAGGSPAASFDGTSFAKVLSGKSRTHRDFAYNMHNNLPEGPRYPIRSITDGRFRYIRNLLPQELYIEKHVMAGKADDCDYWPSWTGADPLKNRPVYEMVRRYMSRPAEELYLTTEDPYELNNLADDPAHADSRKRLAAALDQWLSDQADPGAPVDSPRALQAARKGRHLHGPSPRKQP